MVLIISTKVQISAVNCQQTLWCRDRTVGVAGDQAAIHRGSESGVRGKKVQFVTAGSQPQHCQWLLGPDST